MSATDVGAKVKAAALAAIDQQSFGEDFGIDCAPLVAPTPGGGVMVVYSLILTRKSPLLGQGPLVNVTHLNSPSPTGEQVEQAITQAMAGLRKYASDLLAAPAAPGSGQLY